METASSLMNSVDVPEPTDAMKKQILAKEGT